MSYEMACILLYMAGAFAAYLNLSATVALMSWGERRRTQQLEADFRAFVMVEEAKRHVSRLAADAVTAGCKPQKTGCGANGPTLLCPTAVDAELERAVCALEAQWGVRGG